MKRLAYFLMVAIVAAAASLPTDARACSVAGTMPYAVNTGVQVTDQVPPTLPALSVAHLHRGEGTAACTGNSCAGMGTLGIGGAATDDVARPEGVGYRFTVVAGALPPGFTLPSGPTKFFGDQIWLNWDDGATDDQDSIDFTLQVVAIDFAGNESAPQTVRVQHAGSGGCAIARPREPARGLAFIVVAALLLAGRRRAPGTRRKTLRGSTGSRPALR